LDGVLAAKDFGQIVHLPQLTSTADDWALDRIDGPRWLVFSSAQLSSTVPAGGTELALAREATALARGATVVRPTMIFGGGRDRNITRVARFLRRTRFPVVVGDGEQRVQPTHIADLIRLVAVHGETPVAGLFGMGSDEPMAVKTLIATLCDELGIRRRVITIPARSLELFARLPLPGLRPDQVRRLAEDKLVDSTATFEAFGWRPEPLDGRLRQAVREAS
jgi:nucleoside-diphosphate-sugar epimerase